MKQVFYCVLLICIVLGSCRSRGPHNEVWESKRHPSDQLRKEYKQANDKGTKDYKNSKKRFKNLHRKGKWF